MEMSPLTSYWDSILDTIRRRVSQQTFETWFMPLQPLSWDQAEVQVLCPNFFYRDWFGEHHLQILEQVLSEYFDRDISCVLQVNVRDDAATKDELFDLGDAIADPGGIPSVQSDRPAPRIEVPAGRVRLNREYAFANFVIGAGSKMAHAASYAVSEQPGRGYNPLFIHGGVGLGKTHLMHAIGNAAMARDPNLGICYVTAEQFMNDLIWSIQKNSTYDFKRQYRNVDVLLVDDVAFLAGKESTQKSSSTPSTRSTTTTSRSC